MILKRSGFFNTNVCIKTFWMIKIHKKHTKHFLRQLITVIFANQKTYNYDTYFIYSGKLNHYFMFK